MLSIEKFSAKVHRNENITRIKGRLKPKLFGQGGSPDYPEFYELSIPEQTYYLLYQNGCRVPYKSMTENDKEWMRLRAGETNSAFALILDRAKKLNKPLYYQLRKPQKRNLTEPMPQEVYEPHTGPRANKKYIYPMQGIYGYAGSRVFREITGRRGKRTSPMILNAFKVLDSVIKKSETRSEFVARLAGQGFKNGANVIDMLSHILPNGILTEQNCFKDYQALAADLKIHAPMVWKAYQDANEANKKVLVQNDIAPMNRFLAT